MEVTPFSPIAYFRIHQPLAQRDFADRGWPFLHSLIPWFVLRHALFQERVPHSVWFSASSFSFQYPLVSLKSSSICLRLLPHISIPSLLPSTFPSVTCFKKHFLRQNITNLLAFLLCIVCRIYLPFLTPCNAPFLTRSAQLIFSMVLQHRILKLSRYFWSIFRSVQAQYKVMLQT